MTRVDSFNSLRWIIIFHVAFIVQSKVNAQSGQAPSPRTSAFAVLITVFFLIGLLSVYIRHCSNPRSSTRHYHRQRHGYVDSSRRGGLDDAVVESFPVFSYSSVKESKIGSGDLECAICLNELEDRETVRLLPICNHLFHIDCIDAWLYSHATCPVCRSDLTAKCEENDTETRSPIRDQVAIDISTEDSEKISHRVRLGFEIAGKFPRSNSTGHSIGRFGDCTERFTLRLPDDVKRRIMAAKGRRLKRARSLDGVLTAEGRSEENSYTGGSGEKSDRVNWVDRLGLFVTKSNSGSLTSQKSNGEPLK